MHRRPKADRPLDFVLPTLTFYSATPRDGLEQILCDSRFPALPTRGDAVPDFETVMSAWNGSDGVPSALPACLPLLRKAAAADLAPVRYGT